MKTTFPLSLCLLWVAVFVTRASAQDPFAPTTIRAGDSNAVARALAAGGPVDTNLLAELHADAMARLAPADESSAPSFKPLPVPAVRAAATVPQARQSLEIFGTGARARFGPAEVTFAGNALAAEAVEMVGPQGLRLRSRILGVAYLDPNSGQSVLLAEPRDATGEVLPPDRVVFWDALDDLSADVVYTLRPNSLEQDVILRRQLPPPEEFGLRGDALQLAVITEFFSPPVPRRTARTIAIADPLAARGSTPTLIADETIKFGALRIVEGRAFSLGDDPEPVPTGKSWTVIEGRHFLVEATPLQLIARKLAALPRYAGSPPRRPTGDFHDLLAAHRRADASGPLLARMEVSNRKLDARPGRMLTTTGTCITNRVKARRRWWT